MRDYETVKVEQEVPNEFLLVLYDGNPPEVIDDSLEGNPSYRGKGAFYKNIERKMHLKKKRANVKIVSSSSPIFIDLMFVICQVYEQYEDKWEIIRVLHAPMSKDEEEEREEALAEVADPMFLMHRGDADADGDIEVDDGTGGHLANSYLPVS